MGQMTFALMLGCKIPQLPKGKRWWGDSEKVGGKWVYQDGLLETFVASRAACMYDLDHGMKPQTDENGEVVGFFVAVGASGKRDVPYLEGPIDLAGVAADQRYKEAVERTMLAWEDLALFCGEHGVTLAEPRLWLVETEVA